MRSTDNGNNLIGGESDFAEALQNVLNTVKWLGDEAGRRCGHGV